MSVNYDSSQARWERIDRMLEVAGSIPKPAWLEHLEALADALEHDYPLPARPDWMDDRPKLTLIQGGRDA